MIMSRMLRFLTLLLSLAVFSTWAQEDKYNELFSHVVEGPTTIKLGNQGSLALPKEMFFLPKEQANKLMEMNGNLADSNRYGLIFPMSDDAGWAMDLMFSPTGYIKDDDAANWDIDSMLKNIRKGVETMNKKRREMQLPELDTSGWIEKPIYDASEHLLIWSIDVHDKYPQPGDTSSVNYNMYALGREGYINITLVTSADMIDKEASVARDVLSRITFNEGKRYSDFNPTTDKIAEYGLAALIGGGLIAKKFGLIALIGAFVLKFAKLFVILGAGILAVFAKLFKRKD